MRRFQHRLHLQRAAVTLSRALALAALAATVVLLLRVFGQNVPLPLAPLIAAGALLAVLVASIPLQRPSLPQIARALDQRLELHELIGSALEVPAGDSRLATRLHERAQTALQNANPAFVLPWPSLRRERWSVAGITALCALSTLLATHAPPVRPVAAGTLDARAAAHAQGRHAASHARSVALPVHLLGQAAQRRAQTATTRSGQAGRKGAPAASARQQASGAGSGQRHLSSGALQIHKAQGQGSGAAKGNGSSAQAGTSQSTKGAGSTSGRGATNSRLGSLHLTASKNSAAGGVYSPQQQQLVDLQNSISAAQNASTRAGQNGPQAQRQNAQRGRGSGKNGSGTKGQAHATGRRQGAQGTGNQAQRPGAPGSQSPYQASASARTTFGHGGPTSEFDPRGRFLHGAAPGDGQGPDPFNAPTQALHSGGAQLGNSSNITLNGTPGRNGRLLVSVGGLERVPALGSGSTSSTATNPIITVPGYVAPDSNAVAPADRPAVQSYFSPQDNGQ